MNREIKFRAWDKENKIMLRCYEILFVQGGIRASDGCTTQGWVKINKGFEHLKPTLVLLEYTGLKDIKGNEIYEGDIVKITGNYKPGIYTVIWDSYRVAWWLKNVKKREREYDDDFYQLLDNPFQEREVIGNIYENPEAANGR